MIAAQGMALEIDFIAIPRYSNFHMLGALP